MNLGGSCLARLCGIANGVKLFLLELANTFSNISQFFPLDVVRSRKLRIRKLPS